MQSKFVHGLIALALALVIAGCGAGAGAGPRVWIDFPLDGANLALGPVVVQSHSAAAGGTAQVVLMVNGSQSRIDNAADPANDLAPFAQSWVPTAPGDYTLQVLATDHAGNQGTSNVVTVHIGNVQPEVQPQAQPEVQAPETPTLTPTVQAFSEPTLVLVVGANCRAGPGTDYEVEDAYPAGQELPIEGQSSGGDWFWVLTPYGGHCWVAASTGNPRGPFASVQVRAAPPLPQAPPVQPEEPSGPAEPPPPSGPPSAPSGFSVSTQSCSSQAYIVALNWGDASGEQGYRVYRDGSLITTLGAGATSYSDTSPNFNSHSYRVDAYNGSGTSASPTKNSEGCLY
jgi:hypothetical protein